MLLSTGDSVGAKKKELKRSREGTSLSPDACTQAGQAVRATAAVPQQSNCWPGSWILGYLDTWSHVVLSRPRCRCAHSNGSCEVAEDSSTFAASLRLV